MSGNREYKSDVFSMLIQDKERALQLYNAMNGSSYDNPEDVEIVIHDGGISLSVRNDASFIVDARLSIYEHQSTVCPNMPVRSLIYLSVILSDMLSDKKKGTKTVTIPASAPYSYSDQKLYILNIGYACTKRITYHI